MARKWIGIVGIFLSSGITVLTNRAAPVHPKGAGWFRPYSTPNWVKKKCLYGAGNGQTQYVNT